MKSTIHKRITESIPDAEVQVDLDGNRAVISVVSGTFAGMSRVQKHQAVYAAIESFIADGSLHAVSIKALVATDP